MAIPAEFPQANIQLNPASGTEHYVGSMPAYHQPGTKTESPILVSCWRLTPEELQEINAKGVVWLSVLGDTSYPVLITVQSPFEEN